MWPTIGTAVLVVITGLFVGIVAGIPSVLIFGQSKNPASVGNGIIEAAFYLGGAAVLIPLLERISERPSLHALGVRPLSTRDWGIALGGLIAVLLLQFFYQFVLIGAHQQNHIQAGFENFSVTSFDSGALMLLNGALIAPIVEELYFRGLIFNALAVRMPFAWAALGSGILFGAAHGDPVLFPVLAIFGAVNALLYRASGNLVVPMLVHSANNLIFLSLMIAVPGFH
ncbi:MAG: CPBP family intramembrane metalloprotease [Candidatus Eremiobacteraeota bacterium]|nr:CPBP family intramembrane metalloprotease [Candidatus Eremiobacteraeota bacterium]